MTKQVGSPNIFVQIENRIWCFNIEIATIQIHAVIHLFHNMRMVPDLNIIFY